MDEANTIKKIGAWLGSGSINLFGPPYAGKDTHGHRLARYFDAVLLGGGEILRNSDLPKNMKALHSTGKLFPSDIYSQTVLPYLQQEKFTGRPLILSSVGRRQGEEVSVLEVASAAGHPVKAVIYLYADESVIWERWQHSDSRKNRGERNDDTKEALKVRLEEFKDKTMPVIDFYRNQNLLIEIDSNQPKDAVSKEILDHLLALSKS